MEGEPKEEGPDAGSGGRSLVLFNLKAGVSDERCRGLLTEIESWEGIARAGLLLADSPVEPLRRAFVATLEPEGDASRIVDRLREIPEVESASVPAPRRLAESSPAQGPA